MRSIVIPDKVPTIETPRLTLRQIEDSDAESYYRFCSDTDVMRTWGTKPHLNISDTQGLIEFHRNNLEKKVAIRWGVSKKGSNDIIGDIGYWRFIKERLRAEVGAKLSKELWSNGYMYEAGAAVLDFGFRHMKLHSIESSVDPRNIGAIKLVTKLNFQREGVNREHSYCDWEERFIDTHLYTLLEHDWIREEEFKVSGVL